MAFVPKPNTGALFPNNKRSDNHPDHRGDIHLDRAFLKRMLDKVEGDVIAVSVSAWTKRANSGLEFLSLSISEPYVPKAAPTQNDTPDEDVPF